MKQALLVSEEETLHTQRLYHLPGFTEIKVISRGYTGSSQTAWYNHNALFCGDAFTIHSDLVGQIQ